MDIGLEELDYQTFEDLCNSLLRREVGGITSIEGAGGDNGVDGFRGEIDGKVVIYQHKFFPGRIKSSRRSKIVDSFETAQSNHPEMEKWVLLIATEFTHGEQEWFEREIKQASEDIDIEYWNKKEIEDKLCRHRDLVDRYFPQSILALSRKQQEVVNYLSGTPIERAWLMQQRLDELKEENPHLGLGYEFSSEENKQQVTLDPDSPIQVNTRLQTKEEKYKKIQHGEEVRFSEEEIVDIDFNPEALVGDEFEPSELVVKPQYKDWERDVQIEIPGGSFRKELTMTAEDVSDDSITLQSRDQVFRLGIKYDVKREESHFHLNPDFENQPLYRISEFLDFVDQIETHERILMRDLEEGNPVMRGEIQLTDSPGGAEYFREVVDDLEIIESRTGCSFTLTSDFDDDDDLNAKITRGILTEGEAMCPFNVSAEINDGAEEEILQIHEDNEFTEVQVEIEDFEVTIMDQQITLGDVRFKYPNPVLANAEEIQREADQPGPSPLELHPSEEATIEALE